MRILHVTPLYPPSIGGVERYVYHLVKEQRLLGHDVYVITSNFPSNRSTEKNTVRLPVLCRPRGKWGYIPICPTIFKSLREIKYDVIHAHTPPKFFAESTGLYRLLKRKREPFTLTYHLHNEALTSLPRAIWHVYNSVVMRSFFKTTSRIIALTNTYRTIINRTFGINFEKIEVVPTGVDDKYFDPQKYLKEDARERFRIFDENVIVFIGRLIGVKGVSYLIRALPIVLNELHDTSLVVVGDGALRSDLQLLTQKLNVNSHVKFLGHISNEDVPRVLSLASVLVLPSLSEGLPLILLETMSMKKPVVATRVGGIPDLVVNGKTGILVEKKNVQELANAILKVLSDKKLAKNMGRFGRKLVKEKYRWSIVAQNILESYESCLTT